MSATATGHHDDRAGLGGIVRDYFAKVRGGDVGSLPAVLGLIVAGHRLLGPAARHVHRPRSTSPT